MSCGCGGQCCDDGWGLGAVNLKKWPIDKGGLPVGVVFAQGFHLSRDAYASVEAVMDLIAGCLYQSGYFSELTVSQPTSFFSYNEFWLIEGRTAIAFGDPQDLQKTIVGWIQACALNYGVVSIDKTFDLDINNEPGPQGVDIATTPVGSTNQNSSSSDENCPAGTVYRNFLYGCVPSSCPAGQKYKEGWFSAGCSPEGEKGFLEELGLSSKNSAIIGVVAALGGVILISKLAR